MSTLKESQDNLTEIKKEKLSLMVIAIIYALLFLLFETYFTYIAQNFYGFVIRWENAGKSRCIWSFVRFYALLKIIYQVAFGIALFLNISNLHTQRWLLGEGAKCVDSTTSKIFENIKDKLSYRACWVMLSSWCAIFFFEIHIGSLMLRLLTCGKIKKPTVLRRIKK